MRSKEWKALPLGQIRIEHGFPDRGGQSITVYVEDEPVARLGVTKVGFEHDYSTPFGYVTLRMVAGDCQILASRPDLDRRASSASTSQLGADPGPVIDHKCGPDCSATPEQAP